MNNKADRLKAALRENLKRRKAHRRDRAEDKPAEREPATDAETEKDKRQES